MSKFHIQSKSEYNQQYQASIANPKKFWGEIANNFTWFEKFSEVENCNLEKGQIEWFKNGKTNISYNCLDRHLEQSGDKTAIIWESNDPQEKSQKITYKELHQQVCQFANLLLARGVKVGDRVCIYMPMIPQSVVAMLACARIGAIHSVVFAGFSAKSLAGRIKDCGAKILITSDLLFRGDKEIALFEIAKEALLECDLVTDVILYSRSSKTPSYGNLKPLIWQEEVAKYSATNQAPALNSQDPLFILYTSGSTGNPKGIVHSLGGYMVYAGYSFQNVFNYQQGDIHFCSADIGWITGHSYLVYGPLLNGATILMFEGIPTHPTPARFWQVIDKHKVNIFYTAPTAIRALMQKGDEFVEGHDLSSLKTLGSVGEPINEEAWHWYNEKVGKKKCPIVDTWWQTETGGILISSMAGVTESKPSHAGLPLPGIVPILLDDAGNKILEKNKIGNLCFSQPWPSMALGVWGDPEKFLKTYYQQFPGYYLAGDGAFCDEDGLYRIIGRTDDVIKVSGHRLGTAEIENAVNLHSKVSESAAIGLPHEVKGEGVYVFVILKAAADENLEQEILANIQKEIGAIARPEKIYFVSDLPKTRSGKIMRRILKKIVAGEEDLGDISTLVNPEVVQHLKNLKKCN
ncbi:MAG: acetate--CoA ligase [Rickettsiales bacterium]|nr:acetate--CoA ligase [Rickettsiales bacterium]